VQIDVKIKKTKKNVKLIDLGFTNGALGKNEPNEGAERERKEKKLMVPFLFRNHHYLYPLHLGQ
jgi:hypothetical protein